MTTHQISDTCRNFLKYIFGQRSLGSAGDEEISTPYSPELAAYLEGRLGRIPQRWWSHPAHEKPVRDVLTAFLRQMADEIEAIP